MTRKLTPVERLEEELKKNLKHIIQNADSDMMEGIFKESKVQEKESLIHFFIWFRNNGEKHIGISIEKLIDKYYEETYGEK